MVEVNQIIDLDSGNILGYYCKGHVSVDEFVAIVDEEYTESITEEQVRQCYQRNIPYLGQKGLMTFKECAPGKGAYAVTKVEL